MEKISNLMGEKTNPKALNSWREALTKKRLKDAENAWNNGNTEYSQLIAYEHDGGNCPRCNKSFRKIEVKNYFWEGFYYRPDCECYYRCPQCEIELFDEMFRGVLKKTDNKCPRCKWPLVKDGKKYWGKDWDKWFKDNRTFNPAKIHELKKELGLFKQIDEKGEEKCKKKKT